MKKTKLFKTILLLSLTLLQTIPAHASVAAPSADLVQPAIGTIVGNIDFFNDTHLHGWAYDTANTKEADELLIKITNAVTGETVEEVTADPDTQRSDLTEEFGDDCTPAFSLSLELDELPDGIYKAAGYQNGQKVTGDAFYTKGDADSSEASARSLGTFRLTAYCPCYSCSGKWGSLTSTGKNAVEGHTVAVDKRVIPMGSRLMINGKVYTAEDVGGGVRGNHIDIFFNSHAECLQFGSQHAEVYLLQ